MHTPGRVVHTQVKLWAVRAIIETIDDDQRAELSKLAAESG